MKNKLFVIDTNILISSIAFGGSLPDLVLRKALEEGVLVFSQATLDEFQEVIMRPKFDKYISKTSRQTFFFEIATSSLLVEPKRCKTLCRDPKDQMFLELHHEADLIISGDQDLLVLEKVGSCQILNPADMLETLFS